MNGYLYVDVRRRHYDDLLRGKVDSSTLILLCSKVLRVFRRRLPVLPWLDVRDRKAWKQYRKTFSAVAVDGTVNYGKILT